MRSVILVVLAITLMGGGCQPFIIGTAALQGVPVLVNPVADALGRNIAQFIDNVFAPFLETDTDTEVG